MGLDYRLPTATAKVVMDTTALINAAIPPTFLKSDMQISWDSRDVGLGQ